MPAGTAALVAPNFNSSLFEEFDASSFASVTPTRTSLLSHDDSSNIG